MEKIVTITVARSDQINCKLIDIASVRWLSRILHQTVITFVVCLQTWIFVGLDCVILATWAVFFTSYKTTWVCYSTLCFLGCK